MTKDEAKLKAVLQEYEILRSELMKTVKLQLEIYTLALSAMHA